jgi:hypothetical protein
MSPLYRHYFNAPLTGSFLSSHKDFEAAVHGTLAAGRHTSEDTRFFLLAFRADVNHTLNNIAPVDMPGNPEVAS